MCNIEPIEAKHYEGTLRVMNAIYREKPFFSQNDKLSLEELVDWLAPNQSCGFPLFVAVEGENVIGWSFAYGIADSSRAHCASLWMGISADRRGLGLGRALLQTTLDQAWKIGFWRVELEVYPDNFQAIRLYRSLGFVEEGMKPMAHLINGTPLDLMGMGILAPTLRKATRPVLQAV